MFTVQEIEEAHSKVKSGADFPNYIQEIKKIGVESFVTFVKDSHTVYYGENNFETKSNPKYDDLEISEQINADRFINRLKIHQKGETDYFTFCKDCALNGIEKWIVDLNKMTCIYFDQAGNEVLTEKIPN